MMNHPTAKKFHSHLAHLALKSVVRFSCVYCDLCGILVQQQFFFFTQLKQWPHSITESFGEKCTAQY